MTDCETLSHLGGQILPHNHSVLAFVEVSSNNTIHQKNDMGHEVTNYSRRHTREPQGTRENGFDTIPTQCKFDTIQQNETMTFYSFFSLRITPHIFWEDHLLIHSAKETKTQGNRKWVHHRAP